MRISGTDIYIAQGDTADLKLNFQEDMTSAEIKMFLTSINDYIESTDIDINEHTVTINIKSTHTAKAGNYFYDIAIEKSGKITTLIRKSLFIVEETAAGMSGITFDDLGENPEED